MKSVIKHGPVLYVAKNMGNTTGGIINRVGSKHRSFKKQPQGNTKGRKSKLKMTQQYKEKLTSESYEWI